MKVVKFLILIVEDNIGDFVLAKKYIKENFPDAEITNAKSYKDAERLLLDQNNFNCILLDLSLPDSSGEELIKNIVRLKKDIPILIVLTGHDDLSFSLKTLSMGVSDYLIKNEINSAQLFKSIFYSYERFKIGEERDKALLSEQISNEKYKILVEQASDAILLINESGNILEANHTSCEIFECTKEEILNLKYQDLFFKETENKSGNPLHQLSIGKENRSEQKVITKDGNTKHFDIIEKLLSNGMIQSIIRDITERKNLESKLRFSKEELEKAYRVKSEFLANMSHEVRTPINGIIGFTDLLKGMTLEENQRFYIDQVSKSGYFLLDLVNDILDFSKFESGKLTLKNENINTIDLLDGISNFINFKSDKKEIKKILTISPDFPKLIELDPIRLKQILLNLISNAVKFTSEGEIECIAKLIDSNLEEGEVKLYFAVRDTGIGISKDNIAIIFDPFVQADSSTNRKFGGTGLGLTITKSLLSLFNSELKVESKPGVGTIFSFELIAKLPNIDGFNRGRSLTLNDIDKEKILSIMNGKLKAKILVVDDDPINLLLTGKLLKRVVSSLEYITAENGAEAIELFKTYKPDLILMDLQMPVMNGYDATIEIRKLDSKVPILAVTAGKIDGGEKKCLEVGMNEYINKPLSLIIIGNIIIKIFARNYLDEI